jgi:ATP-binding cassette subfamily B protein
VFWVVLVAVIMLWTVSYLFSLVLIAWLLMHMGISLYFARKVTAFSHQHSEDQTLLKGHIVDLLTNIATARLFARNNYEQSYVGRVQEIEKISSGKTRKTMMHARLVIDFPLVMMFVGMLFLLVHGWQSGWVVAGDIVLVMFTVFNVMGLAWMLGTELPNFFSELGVANQALTLINQPHGVTDTPDAKELVIKAGHIEFDKVNFHYVPQYNIFSDKSLSIEGGQKVGLVGFSGSGKSTFVNLILRFYDVESGRILIDGHNIAEVMQDSLRSQIAMIPQDTTLFHRSLMENIRYGRLQASDEEVIAAAKKAHCHEFIEKLPEGYQALVGERGVKLSGGQRQRIAIARAILKDAPILLLDEATSALDSNTEELIKESLADLMKGRTTIVIAHRLSTLLGLDRILVFNEGHIVEDGSHGELLAANGHYAKLWNMQAGGFLPEL